MRYLIRRLSNTRLRTKFLLILASAMLIVCIGVFATIRLPYAAYDEQLYKSSVKMSAIFAERIQSGLTDIEELSYRILADNVLQKNLTTMQDMPINTASWVSAKTEIGDRMSYFAIWFNNVKLLQLKTAGGESFIQGYGRTHAVDKITAQHVDAAMAMNGREKWMIEEKDQPELYLLREIRETRGLSLRPMATLLIKIDLEAMVEQNRRSMAALGSPLECAIYSGETCLYASDERVASLPYGEDGYEYMNSGGEALCVRYTAPNGWQYVTLVDYGGISDSVKLAERMTLGVILASVLLALVVSAILIASIVRHLQVLVDKFDAFAANGRPVPEEDSPYLKRGDEIGKLHRHFDKMTRDYDRLTRENTEKQRILQEKQMQQLRAQVCPHFLYNTLESIYCLSQSAPDKRIATMTDALGKMLRASLNDKRDIVTIEDDLQITREYLRIQLIRYGERLQVEYDVPDEFAQCKIPAMTIQPLVENAVHHAADNMLDTCVIRIFCRAAVDGIDVTVEDNGQGIDEDILEKLESGEIRPEGLGIGMRNIHRRVQYAFSNEYGLRVKNEDGHTRIVIHLPDTRA